MVVVVGVADRILLPGKDARILLAVVPVAIRDHASVPNEQEVVDEPEPAGIDVGDERIDGRRIQTLRTGSGDRPFLTRPDRSADSRSGGLRIRRAGGDEPGAR